MGDTQVTATQWGSQLVEDPNQLVTQVFSSACAIAYNEDFSSPKSWEPFASLVLEAAYEATFHAALLNAKRHKGKQASKVVFLTALGGGVFGNSMQSIAA